MRYRIRETDLENEFCGAVVIARDEEDVLEECLESLRLQTIRTFLVVVDDGSKDKTGEIASKYADVVVGLPSHEDNWTGRPELARVFNSGFKVLRKEKVNAILISGADAVYPPDYLKEIVKRMVSQNIVLASGVAEGEESSSTFPRGCGRVINAEWFKEISFEYPERSGFEGYPMYKALSQGHMVAIYPDLKFKLSRGTRLSGRKLYSWGKGMKALNYWWLYAVGRAFMMGLKQPVGGYNLLKGYFTSVTQYEDLGDFVPFYQKKTIMKRIINMLISKKRI